MAVLSIGTCSSFGGVAAASPNPTGVRTVGAVAGVPTINIPGCPTHPDWVVWTIAQLLLGNSPALDAQGRPADLFAGEKCNVHKRCPRREGADEAEQFGLDGYCLEELGCKGPVTQADCPTRKWNNGENWCVGANSICIGCTEKGFPDRFSPFYRELEEEEDDHDSDHDLSVSRRRG
jgi:hydrogenase small subunit